MKDAQWVLLDDWTWATPADLCRFRWPAVWVFASRRQADRARRTYGPAARTIAPLEVRR